MNGNRQNIWFAVWGTSLCLLLAIAGALAQSPSPASAGSKLAEEEFKNIQALKGIPADQIIPSMQFIAASWRRMRVLPRCACERKGRQESQSHRSEEHTSELQSLAYLVCRLLLEKKKQVSTI